MLEKIKQLKEQFKQEIAKISDLLALDQLEIKYLGRKAGELTKILRNLKEVPQNQRREIGQLANEFKNEIAEKIREAEAFDLAYTLELDDWEGQASVSLAAKDIKPITPVS